MHCCLWWHLWHACGCGAVYHDVRTPRECPTLTHLVHAHTHICTYRLEEAQEAAAGLREQLTEARRKLREVLDEEKELKKRRRAATLALATVSRHTQPRGF